MKKKFTLILFYISLISTVFSQSALLKDINTSGSSYTYYFFEYNSAFYFFADDGTGGEVWKSNGTTAGTQILKDINPSGPSDNDAPSFTIYNGELYFSANDGTNGSELWKTDGTDAGTVRVSDVNSSGHSYPRTLTVYNSELYFSASNGSGTYLYKTNGTTVTKVSNIESGNAGDGDMIVYNSELYFGGIDGSLNEGLYKTNGTPGAETLVKEISSNNYYVPLGFKILNSSLIFLGRDVDGREIWTSDGTTVGTQLLKDINPAGDANPSRLTLFNGEYYFSADDGANGRQFWKTNGTSLGTQLVKNISLDSKPEFAVLNSELFFAANDGINGMEIWKSDGTTLGTVMVKDINSSDGSYPIGLIVFNNNLYFGADNNTEGAELWRSDGTGIGTVLLQDIYPGASSSDPVDFFVYNNNLYFNADEGTNGNELWMLTGATGVLNGGEEMIKVFPNPVRDFVMVNFTDVNNVKQVNLYNNLSQKIKEFNVVSLDPLKVSLEDMNSGIYYLVLIDSEGKKLIKKIVKN